MGGAVDRGGGVGVVGVPPPATDPTATRWRRGAMAPGDHVTGDLRGRSWEVEARLTIDHGGALSTPGHALGDLRAKVGQGGGRPVGVHAPRRAARRSACRSRG
jgi:hypothetical protein